jgi:hypothetical protein
MQAQETGSIPKILKALKGRYRQARKKNPAA